MLIAIDPGYLESAYVALDGTRLMDYAKEANAEVLDQLRHVSCDRNCHLVIEEIQNFGMPAGAELFETVFWSGRFAQAWAERGLPWSRLTRKAVVGHICHNGAAKDANVRQAILDRYGGKAAAIGRKASPGPLYGFKSDLYSALALGLTYLERSAVRQSMEGE